MSGVSAVQVRRITARSYGSESIVCFAAATVGTDWRGYNDFGGRNGNVSALIA